MKRFGFTLVEILAVLVIIGVLIAIALPNIQRSIATANTRSCANNINNMDAAIQLFFSRNNAWPANLAQIQPFLQNNQLPVCAYGVAYTLNAAGTAINRAGHFTAANFPRAHVGQGF